MAVDRTDPWHYAALASRYYLTPEDIGAAIRAGAQKSVLQATVLEALSQKRVEDWSLCAFVAWKFEP